MGLPFANAVQGEVVCGPQTGAPLPAPLTSFAIHAAMALVWAHVSSPAVAATASLRAALGLLGFHLVRCGDAEKGKEGGNTTLISSTALQRGIIKNTADRQVGHQEKMPGFSGACDQKHCC